MNSLIAFINTVPQLVKLVTLFVDKWQEYQISKLSESYSQKDKRRSAIINAIKKAETDEERKVLARLLYDINFGPNFTPSELRNRS
jgi:hypothetical protein